MRVLGLDSGLHLGYAALGGDKPVLAGSRLLRGGPRDMGRTMRHCDSVLRELILEVRPDVIAFASPFVALIRGRAVQPNAIRPLFGILAKIEEVADELQIRCTEWDESAARRRFLDGMPRKSKDIKRAVMQGCRDRGWPCCDDHAGDALCVAALALERLEPATAHETTPLFQAAPLARARRKARKHTK